MIIVEAIKQVMSIAGKPLTISEAYEAIIKNDLYRFNADNPSHIVRNQIRRHCKRLDFPSSSPTKHFEELEDGKYFL